MPSNVKELARVIMGQQATRLDRRDMAAIALIAALWVAMTLLVNPVGDFPLNDDWQYGRTVKALLSGAGILIPGAVRGPTIANILTQALWGVAFCLPFGFSYTALRISTLVLAVIGLAFFYALMRENGNRRSMAIAATLTLAVSPLYFGMAESFMTDVPFVAIMIVALYFLARALRDDSTSCLVAGVAVSFIAILTKQIGFAPLLGYAAANALKHKSRVGQALLGFVPLILGIGLQLGYHAWLLSSGRGSFIPAQIVPLDPVSLASWTVHSTLYALPYLGFAVFPVVALTGLLPRASAAIYLGLAAAGLAVLMLLWWRGDLIPVLGNIFNESGMGPLTQRDTYLLRQNLPVLTAWTTAFWLTVTACGLIGTVGLFAIGGVGVAARMSRLWRGQPVRNDWVWVLAVVTGIGYWAAIVFLATNTGEFWDRYVLPAIPLALLLLAAGDAEAAREVRPMWRNSLAGAILFVIGGLSVAVTHDYLEWNRTRWVAVHHLIDELGVSPANIDGGYEVNGSLMYRPGIRSAPGASWWFVTGNDYVVASGPIDGYREIARYPVTPKFLPVGLRQVIVLHRADTSG